MDKCNLSVGLCLLMIVGLSNSYEKCTQGISHDECFVGSCCKIDGKWECRTSGLEACDSLAEKDEGFTQRPNAETDSTNKVAIIIPVATGCGCLILLILCVLFAIYIRRRYREKPYVSSYQSRNTGSNTSLVNNSVPENQDEAQQIPPPRIWSTHKDDLRHTDGRNKRLRDYGHDNVPVANGAHNKRSNGSRTPNSESQNYSSRKTRSRHETSEPPTSRSSHETSEPPTSRSRHETSEPPTSRSRHETAEPLTYRSTHETSDPPTNRSRSSRSTINSSTDLKTSLQDLNQEPYNRRPGRHRTRRDIDERVNTPTYRFDYQESSYEKPPTYAEATNSTGSLRKGFRLLARDEIYFKRNYTRQSFVSGIYSNLPNQPYMGHTWV